MIPATHFESPDRVVRGLGCRLVVRKPRITLAGHLDDHVGACWEAGTSSNAAALGLVVNEENPQSGIRAGLAISGDCVGDGIIDSAVGTAVEESHHCRFPAGG